MPTNTLSDYSPYGLAALRVMTALLFMQHGLQKLFGFPAPGPEGLQLVSLMGLAATLETFGGALLAIGLFTRPVAFVLSGFMAVAYFMAHAPQGFYPLVNGGEGAILYCFIFLYLVFAGPGALSLDTIRARQSGLARA